MIDTINDIEVRQELAHRVSGGVTVTLYWTATANTTSIEIFHAATGQTLHFNVPREHALDAFYHPFAHLKAPADEHLVATGG